VLFLGTLALALADRIRCADDGWAGCNGCYDTEEEDACGGNDEACGTKRDRAMAEDSGWLGRSYKALEN
jgi:hypothetical protein